jgi:hypothetical protein
LGERTLVELGANDAERTPSSSRVASEHESSCGSAVSGGWRMLFVPALLAAHGLGFVMLQLGFQRGSALATAGVATLFTNATPIAAGGNEPVAAEELEPVVDRSSLDDAVQVELQSDGH